MEFKLFTDLIDAIGKVASGLKALSNFPKAERDKYRKVMAETYQLIDSALNMVIIRLGDILLIGDDSTLIDEAAKLDNNSDWYQVERDFRLCSSLRAVVRETETLRTQLAGSLSAKDWDALLEQMHTVLAAENELAEFISKAFQELALTARTNFPIPPDIKSLKKNVETFRNSLIKERRHLHGLELELDSIL
jgi:hypothetical protein